MSTYPAAAGQGLYESSATQKHELGAIYKFSDSNGDDVWARYMAMSSGATLAAGRIVAIDIGTARGYLDSVFASNGLPQLLMGGLAASIASVGGYAWVIFNGRQTNASMSTSYASSAGPRFLRPNGSAALVSEAASSLSGSGTPERHNVCAYIESGSSAATGAGGNVIWIWR